MYLKQIQQLVVLQKVDDEIIVLEEELEQAPKELHDLEATVEQLQQKKDQAQEKIEILKNQQKRLEEEIENDANRIRKSKNKLMMVGNTREYHAMMREMDSLEKMNRMREEERVALVEELGLQEESKAEVQAELDEMQGLLDEKKAGLQERIDTAKKRLASLRQQRKNAGKAVPKPILGRYEFIRSRLPNPVIVSVNEGVCGGCNIQIPPQSYNELQKGQQILSCPNCQRLIYWSEHAPEEAKAV
ncbi:MAG: zinc ribbon domain-containing protein [Desulfovibrionaceae bacterium]